MGGESIVGVILVTRSPGLDRNSTRLNAGTNG